MGYESILLFICLIYIQCIAVKYHDYADLNKNEAVELIQRLKKDTLIVVLPTYSKKEALLKLIANNNNGNDPKTNQRLLELYAERQIQLEAFIKSFSEIYTFSSLLYITDSLVSSFEAGVPGQYFVNSSLQIDSSLNYANQQPIKLVQQFDQECSADLRDGKGYQCAGIGAAKQRGICR